MSPGYPRLGRNGVLALCASPRHPPLSPSVLETLDGSAVCDMARDDVGVPATVRGRPLLPARGGGHAPLRHEKKVVHCAERAVQYMHAPGTLGC